MTEYSHRDRRTFRSIWHSFCAIGGGALGVSILVMLAPTGLWGFLGIAGLIAGGAAYLLWSAQLLREYRRDLRTYRDEPSLRTFTRAEMATRVGAERAVGRPSERSPHSRPRRPDQPRPELPETQHDSGS